MSKHYAAHITWRCVNRCAECWVRATVYERPEVLNVAERPLWDWLTAIERDRPTTLELLGGEPFMVDRLYDLVAGAGCNVAVSTNCVLTERVQAFARKPLLPNLVSVTCSYHPDSTDVHADADWRWRCSAVALHEAGYRVSCNLVDYPGHRERSAKMLAWLAGQGVPTCVSPYERTAQLGELRKTGLECRGGEDHLLIAPDGSAYPCFTAFRSPYWRDYCLGNWLDGTVDVTRKPVPCYLDCVDYYVLPQEHSAGDMWNVRARPAGEVGVCAP